MLYDEHAAFEHMLKVGYHPESMKYILQHICWESKEMSTWAFQRIAKSFASSHNQQEVENALQNFTFLLDLNDSLSSHRLNLALNYQNTSLLYLLKNASDKKQKRAIWNTIESVVKRVDFST